jgi:hypothetical protein
MRLLLPSRPPARRRLRWGYRSYRIYRSPSLPAPTGAIHPLNCLLQWSVRVQRRQRARRPSSPHAIRCIVRRGPVLLPRRLRVRRRVIAARRTRRVAVGGETCARWWKMAQDGCSSACLGHVAARWVPRSGGGSPREVPHVAASATPSASQSRAARPRHRRAARWTGGGRQVLLFGRGVGERSGLGRRRATSSMGPWGWRSLLPLGQPLPPTLGRLAPPLASILPAAGCARGSDADEPGGSCWCGGWSAAEGRHRRF